MPGLADRVVITGFVPTEELAGVFLTYQGFFPLPPSPPSFTMHYRLPTHGTRSFYEQGLALAAGLRGYKIGIGS